MPNLTLEGTKITPNSALNASRIAVEPTAVPNR